VGWALVGLVCGLPLVLIVVVGMKSKFKRRRSSPTLHLIKGRKIRPLRGRNDREKSKTYQ